MASLFKRPSGTYYLSFYDGSRRPARKHVSLRTGTKRTAEALQRRLEDAWVLGEYDPWAEPDWTARGQRAADLALLGGAEAAFLASRAHLSPETVERYRHVVGRFVRTAGPDLPTAAATADHVRAFLRSRPLRPVTARSYAGSLAAFFNWLVREGARPDNPVADVALERVPEKHPRYLSPADVDALCREVAADGARPYKGARSGLWLLPVVRANVYLGLRAGELCHVRWDHVDLGARTLLVANTDAFTTKEHRFHIPAGCFWRDVRKESVDIGTALNTSFRAIEDANPRLQGVFQDVDFANKQRFPDAMLEGLLQHFERYRMRRADVPSTVLGDAYEYLIAQFADDAGKKGGEFYTPKQVVRTMVEILRPEEGQTVYDPACGSGGMLLEAVHYMEREGRNPKALTLYGQEKNLNTWAICKMSLFLHDIDDAFVERGDTLLDPKHLTDDGAPRRFDLVLANPPFSLKNWGHKVWSKGDAFGRDVYGCPPKSYGDLAFIQHMVASLKAGGRMAVVVPHGVLFRGGAEGKIRAGLLEDDLVEAVVGLGENLFYGTGIPAAILFLNRDKPAERRGKVLVVNGDKDVVPGKNQNDLSDADVARLAGAVARFEDEDLFCRVVDLDEIRGNDHNLNLTRYVQTDPPPPPIDVAAEVAALTGLLAARDEAERRMMGYLDELGYAD